MSISNKIQIAFFITAVAIGICTWQLWVASAPDRLRYALLAVLVAVLAIMEGRPNFVNDRSAKNTRSGVFSGVIVLVLLAVPFLERSIIGPQSSANTWMLATIVGSGVALTGALLRAWARRVLGQYFSHDVSVSSGQLVIRTGPYSWSRHPAYLGTALVLVGLVIASGSFSTAILGALSIVFTLRRIRAEEALLRTAIPGGEYENYCKSVYMIFGRRNER